MKNLAKTILAAALLGGGLLLTGSCTKTPTARFDLGGQDIRFGTKSPGAATKTEYAGKDNDVTGDSDIIEPIWWKSTDEVRIVSKEASVTDKPGIHYADYVFKSFVKDANNRENKSKATLKNKNLNGLAWDDVVKPYTFYAVYPSSVDIGYGKDAQAQDVNNYGDITAQIPISQTVSAHEYTASTDATAAWYSTTNGGTYTVYEPDMKYAIMTAKADFEPEEINFDANRYIYKYGEENGPEVPLTFYPAFTAFEFTFESADANVPITLTDFRMVATATQNAAATALAGTFTGKAGDRSFTAANDASTTLTLANPSAIGKVEFGKPKSFTIFAIAQTLTGLTVKFTDGEGTRVLQLNDKTGKPLSFAPGRKYRIRGLKLPGNKYQFLLTLNGVVQDWVITTKKTDFTEQIQCGPLTFDKSAMEMTNEYKEAHGGRENHYEDSPIGDGRWQVRTLNNLKMDEEPVHKYMTVYFTPTAPLGGYWRLDTHGNQYFTVKVVDDPESADPTLSDLPDAGQIMNERVYLRIYPNWEMIDNAPASTEIGLYFDCYFSTNIDFDPSLDANTEFQDIHGSGKYSYWLITVVR